MKNMARLFQCAGCQCVTIICSACDRGNLYCSKQCSQRSRKKSLHTAAQRYQNSHKGRRRHAERQRRYRRQSKKVTHHTSKLLSQSDLLPTEHKDSVNLTPPTAGDIFCHYCGRRCSGFLRSGFLQPSVIREDAKFFK